MERRGRLRTFAASALAARGVDVSFSVGDQRITRDRAALRSEQQRLECAQEADTAELAALESSTSEGSMADYERARRPVLKADIAHRATQLQWIAQRAEALQQ